MTTDEFSQAIVESNRQLNLSFVSYSQVFEVPVTQDAELYEVPRLNSHLWSRCLIVQRRKLKGRLQDNYITPMVTLIDLLHNSE